MEIRGRTCVVTGGASGIGRALCCRFAADGVRGVVVADRDGEGAAAVASEIGEGAIAVTVAVAVEEQVQEMVARAEAAFGDIDLMFSNAGPRALRRERCYCSSEPPSRLAPRWALGRNRRMPTTQNQSGDGIVAML